MKSIINHQVKEETKHSFYLSFKNSRRVKWLEQRRFCL